MILVVTIVLSLLAITMSIASVALTLAAERRVRAILSEQVSKNADDRDIDDLSFVADDPRPVRRFTVYG